MLRKFLFVSAFVFAFFIFNSLALAQWAPPTASPPNPGTSAVPLNTSVNPQTKDGWLIAKQLIADILHIYPDLNVNPTPLAGDIWTTTGNNLFFRKADSTTVDLLAGGGTNYWTRDASGVYPATLTDSVGIGTAPAASAILDLVATTKGFLPPRMTTAQRDAIVSPATGLVIYNTITNQHEGRNSTGWVALAGGGSQTPWTSNINAAGFSLFGNNTASGNLTLDSTSNATKGNILLNPTATNGGKVGIATVSPGAMLDVASTQGAGGGSAIRATYPGGGGLLGTEFGALASRNSEWSALYAKQGAATNVAMFDGPGYATRISMDGTGLKIGHNSASKNIQFNVGSFTPFTLDTNGFARVDTLCVSGDCRNSWPAGGGAGGVSGAGTTNYLPKWTAGTAIGNSQVFDNGTNVGIGTASPGAKLDVVGSVRATNFVGALDGCFRLTGRGSGQTGYGNCFNVLPLGSNFCVASKDNLLGSHQDCSYVDTLGCSRNGPDDFCNICCSATGLP